MSANATNTPLKDGFNTIQPHGNVINRLRNRVEVRALLDINLM